MMTMLSLDTLGFVPRFRSTSVSEVPSDARVVSFPAGASHGPAGVWVHVLPDESPDWYGHVGAGDGELSGLWCGPSPRHLTAVVRGEGYIIPVSDPDAYLPIDSVIPICDVRRIPNAELLVVASFRDVAQYGTDGLRWIARDVTQSDLHVTTVTATTIEGFAEGHDFLMADIPFTINAGTGEVIRSGLPPWAR